MAKSKIPSDAWSPIDADSLPAALKKLYKAFKEASKAAAEARENFNTALIKVLRTKDMASEEQTIVVGHNFGKLSFAVTDEAPQTRRGAKEAYRLD